MESANLNFNLIDCYWAFLNDLSPEKKQELISRLSNSLNVQKNNSDDVINEIYGSLITDKSAEQIINNLKIDRNFNRSAKKF